MKTDLHIIAFAVPYPPDYGGAMEVWNRLEALHKANVRVALHGFVYGRFFPRDQLKPLVREVHYYPRSVWPALFTRGEPYIVTSRKNRFLLDKLKADSAPVMFEGIQTTGWVDELKGRKKLLRAHNVEHQYYNQLARNSRGLTSMMFARESQCLETYEKTHAQDFDAVFTISEPDADWYREQGARVEYLPPFHGFEMAEIEEGRGDYLLYQGDLSIEINQRAVLELVRQLSKAGSLPFVIAGKAGNAAFEMKIRSFSNIRRMPDVSSATMDDLIRRAQIILIHSLHREGMKMKLFPALYRGRHILANELSATKTGLDEAIHFYSPETLQDMVQSLFPKPFTKTDADLRNTILKGLPDDGTKAQQIIRYL